MKPTYFIGIKTYPGNLFRIKGDKHQWYHVGARIWVNTRTVFFLENKEEYKEISEEECFLRLL